MEHKWYKFYEKDVPKQIDFPKIKLRSKIQADSIRPLLKGILLGATSLQLLFNLLTC